MCKNEDKEIWSFITKSVKKSANKKVNRKLGSNKSVKNSISLKKVFTSTEIKKEKKDSNSIIELNFKNLKPVDLRNKEFLKTGIDRNTLKKIKKGLFSIDSKLDLHGMYLLEAEKNVSDFILESYNKNNTFLLIVTGKGHQGKGKIRENISNWFVNKDYSSKILAFSYADKKDGGEGAFYVKLRKNRKIIA